MLFNLLIWIMRFVLLGMIYFFLYKVIKVMYSDLKTDKTEEGFSAGIEVVKVSEGCTIPVGTVYPLHPVTSIGRKNDNTIILDSQYVSNYHAKIYKKNNEYVLKDMNSTNGTFLNGNKIDKSIVIKNDYTIDIGGILFKVIG